MSNPPARSDDDPGADPAADEFMAELARALHVYGVPSHRLEEALNEMARAIGIEAQFLTTPTAIVSSVGTRTRLQRIDQGETHLERLTDLHQIMTEVRKGLLSPADATQRIRAFEDLRLTSAHTVLTAVPGDQRGYFGDVIFVTLGIVHADVSDEVCGHGLANRGHTAR